VLISVRAMSTGLRTCTALSELHRLLSAPFSSCPRTTPLPLAAIDLLNLSPERLHIVPWVHLLWLIFLDLHGQLAYCGRFPV
jgi:hypothetical protein